MATKEEILESISKMSVMDLVDLIKEIEEKLNLFDFHTIQLHGSENQKFINDVKSTFQKKIFKSH